MATSASVPSAPRVDIDALRSQLDIVAFAQRLTKIRRAGTVWRGECPCCEGKSKEPFLVDPGSGTSGPHFKCFSCDERGDVFNLYQIQRTGSPTIPGSEFIAVAREAAESAGVSVPAAPPQRVQSAADAARRRVEEAWGIVTAKLLATPLPDGHPLASLPDTARRTLGCGMWLPDQVDGALTALGVTEETRQRAGLTREHLATLQPGVAFVRHGSRRAVGVSQQGESGAWVHLVASKDVTWRPLLAGDAPRGREEVRQLVMALSVSQAVAVWHGLASATDEKAARHIGVVLGGAQQLPATYDDLTRRAIILAPDPVSSVRLIYRAGAELVRDGFAVRVATDEATAPHHLGEAQEFTAWQFGIMRSDVGVAPGSGEAAVWVRDKVAALRRVAADPLIVDVMEHRARGIAQVPVGGAPPTGVVSSS